MALSLEEWHIRRYVQIKSVFWVFSPWLHKSVFITYTLCRIKELVFCCPYKKYFATFEELIVKKYFTWMSSALECSLHLTWKIEITRLLLVRTYILIMFRFNQSQRHITSKRISSPVTGTKVWKGINPVHSNNRGRKNFLHQAVCLSWLRLMYFSFS